MNYSPLLVPIVVLVVWTLVILVWMAASRGSAFKQLGITFGNIPPGSRGANLEGKAPDKVMWVSHNYTHLLEQPTLFYAITLTLAMMGMDQPINVWLAWAYVAFRIIHSLIQCTVNVVRYRFLMFLLASICLIGLTTHAALRVVHDMLGG